MQRIIECVPNFSEGRDPSIIAQIAKAIEGQDGVALLDVDPGQATNRTVITFAGEPLAVLDAAVAAARVGVAGCPQRVRPQVRTRVDDARRTL